MIEQSGISRIYSLFELNRIIREELEAAFPGTFLVTAEIASCDVKRHCYMTLIDKEDDEIRAEMRAVIWANRYKVIAPVFEEETGAKLAKGIRILFEAEVSFHERYGLKLHILNIDPSYTIGEMAVRRREILERLTREELIGRNRQLEFPLVPQRIGIISSATAAGYEDLVHHIANNPYGYMFHYRLYDALMQGDRAGASVVQALNECAKDASALDVVIIVRGGGGLTDLSCFDSYEIGRAIALLPVPVISGIGHHRDVTVTDEVSHSRAKTPTAAADMIIERAREFEERVDSLAHLLGRSAVRLITDARESVINHFRKCEMSAGRVIHAERHRLEAMLKGLYHSERLIRNEKEKLSSRRRIINGFDPRNVLKRGYSITYHDGRPLKSFEGLSEGDDLRTILHKGELISSVRKIKKKGGGI